MPEFVFRRTAQAKFMVQKDQCKEFKLPQMHDDACELVFSVARSRYQRSSKGAQIAKRNRAK